MVWSAWRRVPVWLRLCAAAGLAMASMAWGQAAASFEAASEPQTVTDVLHGMSDRAAVIFTGQVLAVRLPESASSSSGIVEVEFRVDRAIRGCTAGPFVLREWGGLWVGGNRRYRVGQRLLMLLHGPGAGGMSSPVGGLEGAIPIRQSGGVALKESVAMTSVPYVDLRWLGARVPRAISYRSEPVRAASEFRGIAVAGSSAGSASGVVPLGSTKAGDESSPAQQASLDAVLGLLMSWQGTGHATP